MVFNAASLAEALILALTLSADTFTACFAYGSNKIKIPMKTAHIINLICTGVIVVSLLLGYILFNNIPPNITNIISFAVLFGLGFFKLFDGFMKEIIKRHTHFNRELKFSLFSVKFILNVYADPEQADADQSKTLSSLEAVSLALALSIDGMFVGFGAAFGQINIIAVSIFSLISGLTAIMTGCLLGQKVAKKIPFSLSWLSGILLIILAVVRL